MKLDMNKLFQRSEKAYNISVVVKTFITHHSRDVDEFQALLPVILMLHREVDNIYADLLDAGLYK